MLWQGVDTWGGGGGTDKEFEGGVGVEEYGEGEELGLLIITGC